MRGKKTFDIHTGRVIVTCSICLKRIHVKEERLTANLGTGLYPLHYHILCFLNKFLKETIYLGNIIQAEWNPSSRKTLVSKEEE